MHEAREGIEPVFDLFNFIGNRWITSLWTATPHQQPPLDYTELEVISIPSQAVYIPEPLPSHPQEEIVEYRELQKRESDI